MEEGRGRRGGDPGPSHRQPSTTSSRPPALAPIVAKYVAEKQNVATYATYGKKETRAPSGTSSGEEMEFFCPWEKDFSAW
jgi:hypothetical protein